MTHEGEVVERVEVPLCGPAPVAFELDVPIPAELRAFDVELSARADDVIEPIAEVTDLVAGDLYVVTGQSNAASGQYSGDANVNQTPFIRSFGVNTENGPDTAADTSWHQARGNGAGGPGGIGQWPIRMARLLSETHQVPIAIFNGARGGRPIDYFQRDDGDPDNLSTNYGRLLTRMRAAGIEDRVRAILWYQGESDGGDFEAHRAGFLELRDDWAEDYPGPERLYVTQLRAGCSGNLIRTQEVQRLLADEFDEIAVMSTTALDGHDGCHYAYAEGYEELGERYAALLGRDLYGEIPATDVEPPNPASARFEAEGSEGGDHAAQPGLGRDVRARSRARLSA